MTIYAMDISWLVHTLKMEEEEEGAAPALIKGILKPIVSGVDLNK